MNNEITNKAIREEAEAKYKSARGNLLLMLAFTLINVVLLLVEADYMLLFSATVPYYVAAVGVLSGVPSTLAGCIIVVAVILLLYLICWFFSKKHYGWMIVALVMFILDSIAMCALYIYAEDFSGILDVVIHIWVLYYLIIGVKYGAQLNKLPEEENVEQDNSVYEQETEDFKE